MLGLVIDGLLTNLPSDIIGGAAVTTAGYAWMRRHRRRTSGSQGEGGGGLAADASASGSDGPLGPETEEGPPAGTAS
jgi:hypothetical protein